MRIDVRVLAHATILVALTAAPLGAEEIPGTSAITTVTVFPRGAEITRTAQVKVIQGEHILVFKDLPAQAIPASIRVEGRSTGRLEIGSVDTRTVKVPRLDPSTSQSEQRRLELAIEKLDDERAVVTAEVQAAEAQKKFIESLIALPTQPKPAPGAGSEKGEDWGNIFSLIGARLADAEKARLAASIKVRDYDRRIADLEKALSGLAPVEDERTELRVNVSAAAPLEASLLVRYQVPSAGWHSLYDARLTTGARNLAPGLTLIRRAAIQQRSGEDWRDVTLSLSTTRPSSGASAPILSSITVDFMSELAKVRPIQAPPSGGAPAPRSRSLSSEATERRDEADADKAKSMDAPVEEQQAQVDSTAFQAIFALPGKMTVLATGEVKRAQIDDAKVEPTIVVRAVPRVQAQAYIYAKVSMPKTTPYLPGQISLFRDGTFVGTGLLPMLSPGQEHEIGFGADDSVRVRHAVIEDKRGETGLISSSQTDTRSFRITIKNLHERAIAISVLDQMPTSKQQDIKVELTGKTPPTRRDVDDKRGVLAWETTLQPDEERQIEFGYRVSWPAGKSVTYGR
jgi:uncharacterized protein (TIGR02231 family)